MNAATTKRVDFAMIEDVRRTTLAGTGTELIN